MRLKFENHSVLVAKTGGVNFAGYCVDEDGRRRDVLCRVSRDVLLALSHLSNPTPDDLLTAYERHRERINGLASVLFAAGFASPYITAADVPLSWLGESKAA